MRRQGAVQGRDGDVEKSWSLLVDEGGLRSVKDTKEGLLTLERSCAPM